MVFAYHFTTPSEVEKARRRDLLTLYPLIAQLSILAVLGAVLLNFWASSALRTWEQTDEEHHPSSPFIKHKHRTKESTVLTRLRGRWDEWSWRLGYRITIGGYDFGSAREWVFGGAWMTWLLVLCVRDTGEDYLHLTKRFGVIGASQLPVHYLLAMKSPFSPLQIFMRCSHEQLNRAHQVLGRIVQVLLTLHAALYLNFYVQNDLLAKRSRDADVMIGIAGFVLFTIIGTTALNLIRRWNHRVFYAVHVFTAGIFLPLMYFHVRYIRPFILESFVIYIAHFILRYLSTRTYTSSISPVPGTNLTKIEIPAHPLSTTLLPGQHVYLRLPSQSILKSNPFTISSIPATDEKITLIIRTLHGTTEQLASLARTKPSTPQRLTLEGPYGSSARFPDLTTFDSVLLVAGGVGATFIVPIWRNLLRSVVRHSPPLRTTVSFVWAVKSLEETSWAFPVLELEVVGTRHLAELYITGRRREEEGIELEGWRLATKGYGGPKDGDLVAAGVVLMRFRPLLREVVDKVFVGHVKRVAVLVCGPQGMSHELRSQLGKWVDKGNHVFFHSEEFGL